jgi:hypothetical protein
MTIGKKVPVELSFAVPPSVSRRHHRRTRRHGRRHHRRRVARRTGRRAGGRTGIAEHRPTHRLPGHGLFFLAQATTDVAKGKGRDCESCWDPHQLHGTLRVQDKRRRAPRKRAAESGEERLWEGGEIGTACSTLPDSRRAASKAADFSQHRDERSAIQVAQPLALRSAMTNGRHTATDRRQRRLSTVLADFRA